MTSDTDKQDKTTITLHEEQKAATTYPEVTLAGEKPLGHPDGIKERADDVQRPHEDEPPHGGAGDGVVKALDKHVVYRGDDARQPKGQEHRCRGRNSYCESYFDVLFYYLTR